MNMVAPEQTSDLPPLTDEQANNYATLLLGQKPPIWINGRTFNQEAWNAIPEKVRDEIAERTRKAWGLEKTGRTRPAC